MLDPRIILSGQEQADPFETAAKGIQFGQGLRQLLSGRQAGKMAALNPNERQAFADKSMFSRELNTQLRADQAAAQKAQQEALKFNADLYNTYAQGEERIANAGKYKADAGKTNQETGGSRYNLGQSVFMAVAASGSPEAGKAVLNRQLSSGAIDQTTYDSINNQLNGMIGQKPSDIQSLAFNQAKAMLDPKFNFQTKDNEATVNATLNGQNLDYELSQDKLDQDQKQFNETMNFNKSQTSALFAAQQQDIRDGKAKLTEINGATYLDYGNGNGEIYVDKNGQPVKSTKTAVNKAETPEQKMSRVDNVLGSADATRAAARASQDAANLINDVGLYWGTGATSWTGNIPGTNQKAFHAKLENLKSQVFLPAVKALQGMGALSNAEGERVSASIANLDPKIGPEAMKEQLAVLAKQMSAAAQLANKRTQNYASRGGTIPLNIKSQSTNTIQSRSDNDGISEAQSQGFQMLLKKHTTN